MNVRAVALQAYLFMLAFGLFALGLVGLLDFLQQDQPSLYSVMILPDSSLLAMLLGILLAGCGCNNKWMIRIGGGLALMLCIYALTHNLLAGNSDADLSLISSFTRTRNPLAVMAGVAAAGLLLASLGRLTLLVRLSALGLIVAGLLQGMTGFLGISPVGVSGFKTSAELLASLIILLLGLAVMAYSLTPRDRAFQLDKLTLLIGYSSAIIAVGSWYAITQYEQKVLLRGSASTLDMVELNLSRMLDSRLQLLQRMGERWAVSGRVSGSLLWDQETRSYLRDYPNMQFIALIDSENQIERFRAQDADAETIMREMLSDDLLPTNHAHPEVDAGHSPVVLGRQSGISTLLIMPLEDSVSRQMSYLVAGINLEGALEDALGDGGFDFRLRVHRAEQQVYGPDEGELDAFMPIQRRRLTLDHNERWQVETLVRRHALVSDSSHLATWMLGFILLFGFLLMISQRLSVLARQRNRDLLAATEEVNLSLERQQALRSVNQMIMQHSLDMICSFDAQGRFVQISESCRHILGYTPDELIGQHYHNFLLPEDRAISENLGEQLRNGTAAYNFRNRYRHKNGQIVDLMWSAAWSEANAQTFCVARNISELIAEEALVKRQQHILTMISHGEALKLILEAICTMIEERLPGHFASVLMIREGTASLTMLAAPGLPEQYRQEIEGLPVGENQGACGTAAYRGAPVLVEDIATSPLWDAYRSIALAQGLRACWSLPMTTREGEVLGTFALYAGTPGLPEATASGLMATCCQLAGIAIERERDRQRLSESEQRYRSLYRFNPDPVFSLDLSGFFTSINGAGLGMIRLDEAQILGTHFSASVHADDKQLVQEKFAQTVAGESQRFELRAWSAAEEMLELDLTILPIRINADVVGVFGIAKDLRAYNKARRELEHSLKRSHFQSERMRQLKEVAVNLAGMWDSESLYDYLVLQLRTVIGAHQSVMSLTQGDDWSQSINAVSLSDKYAHWRSYQAKPDGTGIYAQVCETNKSMRLTQAELERHPRWRGFGEHAASHPAMNGWLAVPLIDRYGQNVGLLQLSDKFVGDFDEDDELIAVQFAQMVVASMENLRLLDEVVETEQKLQVQLDFTSTVTNSLEEGLLAASEDSRLRFCNPAARRMLGLKDVDITSVYLSTYLPLELHAGSSTSIELEQEIDSRAHCLSCHATPLLDNQGSSGWVITVRDITTERAANKARQERDQFFSLSLEMFSMISLQGYFVQVNPAFVSTLGFSVAELVGSPYIDLIHTLDRPVAEDAINRLVQGEQINSLDLHVRNARGEFRCLEISAALGQDRLIYVVARDITRHREDEATLARHQMLFQIAGQIARVGGWMIDLKRNELLLSDEVCAIHGVALGSTLQLEDSYALYAPEYHEDLRRSLNACIISGEPYEMKAQALTTAGEHIWVRISGRPLSDHQGRISHIQGALQDISSEVLASENLDALVQRMHNILESITDAFYAIDDQWRFTYVNSQAEDLLQVRSDDVLGQNVWDFFPEAKDTIIYQNYHQAMLNNQTRHFEVFYQPLQRWFDVSAYPAENGISVYFRDIGERKRAEQQLQQMLLELERSNRDLQDFAFIASHDLQEPLRKIQAFGERLESRSDQLDETGQDYLRRMRQAASRMQTLIHDLLAYSRVSTRGEPLQPVALDPILDAVLQDLDTLIETSGAQIERKALATVPGDIGQLGQMFQNLITNAIKFQPENQAAQIRIWGEREGEDRWILCIADNGIGFDEKYVDRIFNPFQRLHERTRYAGTGIGLAVVKKIIERHGAAVSVTSAPGQGTTFRIGFRLPSHPLDTRGTRTLQ